MRVRRLKKEVAHLEVTAFINLIVVLVPFLLSTAVFSRLAVVDLSLPARSDGAAANLSAEKLQLEVVIRPNGLDVGDRVGGLFKHFDKTDQGYDLKALNAYLLQVKNNYPDEKAASLLAQPDTPYDTIVQIMDAIRLTKTTVGTRHVNAELFPNLSIGDAPKTAKAN
jgi:biopolymer transport protein ExbD